jgi:proton glutamate symport protein
MGKLALHWKILIGMVSGIIFGLIISSFDWGKSFMMDWISPLGTIFVNLLKLIAVPLILASLIKGVSDLKDIAKFKSIGIRTFSWYILTTTTAILIGLVLANTIKPGGGISTETVEKLKTTYLQNEGLQNKLKAAESQQDAGPLDFLVDLVPDNAVAAMSNNTLMLQVIFFAMFIGISLLLIPEEKGKPIKDFFDSLNEIIMKMVDLIMLTAPFAVFALLSTVIVSADDPVILQKLLKYGLTVVIGLVLMYGVYMILIAVFAKKNPIWFMKQMAPAQMLAFSTSSSAAALPVTMERVEEHVGVDGEVASFVLPMGATVNMDGTSLYQAVASIFIMQVLWPEGLGFQNQLIIILTALLASIGAAAVPGAGMVMLVVVLDSIGFPKDLLPIGLALIFAIDRPLDMLRTTINVTSDATVATIVAKSIDKLHDPKPKEWNDELKL